MMIFISKIHLPLIKAPTLPRGIIIWAKQNKQYQVTNWILLLSHVSFLKFYYLLIQIRIHNHTLLLSMFVRKWIDNSKKSINTFFWRKIILHIQSYLFSWIMNDKKWWISFNRSIKPVHTENSSLIVF